MVRDGDSILVIPLGDVKGRDGRYWEFPVEDAEAVVERIKADAVDIVVDFGHGSYFGEQRAAGWLAAESFEAAEDGVRARVEWTDAGRAAVESKEYRYLSPTFISNGKRILALESVGLVNVPNLADLPALNSMEDQMAGENERELNELRGRVTSLESAKAELERQVNALKAERETVLLELNEAKGELARLRQEGEKREIEEMVEKAVSEGRIAPSQRETCVKIGLSSRETLREHIDKSPCDFRKLTLETRDPGAGGGIDETTLRVANMMGLSAKDLQGSGAQRQA